ncbi:SusC/RagA family TonB-linked outer membrane protein [Spongiimicrobium salis]|uniref:SusC/RagA family TonB-linked outer membrane protein n=1 Tax=Spongiimicrobium salis TaxID=1667022 RepID=UPI00374D7B8D
MKKIHKMILLLALWIPLGICAQTVSGVVTDKNLGDPLAGVNVLVKGTTTGTTTGFDGDYEINASSGDVLIFSYLGFKTVEVVVNGSTLNVAMEEDTAALDEVIVVGYGTTTVKSSTGALTAVTTEDFNKGNIATPENLLNGRVAGLSINTSGAPGSGSEIRIRGGASLNASNSPLIVIDGLPIENNAVGGSRSILSTINPADIESFTVLKDAASTAVYGSRASNGVIIITTKKGGRQLQVDFNSQVGYQTLADTIDVFSGDEFRALIQERRPQDVGLLGNANTNFQEEIYQEQFISDNNFSIKGSLFKGNLPARFSARYTNRPGLRRTSEFESTALSLRLNPRLFDDHLKINLNTNLTFENNRFSPGVEGSAFRFDPTQPVFQEGSRFGGFFEFTDANGLPTANVARNPVAQLLQTTNVSDVFRLYGNLELDYKFHFYPELRAIVNLGYDRSEGSGSFSRPVESALGVQEVIDGETQLLGNFSEFDNERVNQQFNAQLRWDKTFGDFTLGAQAIYNYQKFQSESFSTGEQNDPTTTVVPELNIAPDVVLLTYIGRAEASYKDRYYLSASITRDATSRFSPSERFGNFPSVSAAWTLSEDFFPESTVVDNLKLRASYGVTGQQDIGQSLLFLSRFVLGEPNSQFQFGGNTVPIAQPQFRNELLRWEETTQINLGVDFSFFEGRLSGSLEAYRNESDDLLSFVPIAGGSNFSNAGFQNIGTFSTEGFEFTINADLVKTEDFNWNVNFNGSFFNREIDDLAFDQDIRVGGISGGIGNTIQIQREGFAPNSFFVQRQLFDNQGRPIEGAFADLNGDNVINDSDRFISGNPDPDALLGFSSNINYKRWDLAFFLRASIGNDVYNNVSSANAQFDLLNSNGALGNIPRSVLDTNFNTTSEVILSDIYLEDASFLRLDNVVLGYTFPLNNSKFGSSLRVWGGVQNVFVITDYSGLDPELTGGIDNTIFPRARTFQAGVNYTF